MGSFFKQKTTVTQSPFETNPWKAQQPYLQAGFSGAQSGMDKALATNAGIEDFVANMTPEQQRALQGGYDFSMNSTGTGQGMMNLGMSNAGSLTNFTNNAEGLVGAAGADRTDQIIANAGKFSDNPHIQANIDAALGDVRKAFDRNVGDINSAATGTGNINSTRAGTLEAYAADDAMDRAAAISAGMRGDAFSQGMSLASGNLSDQFAQSIGANQQVAQGAGMGLDTALSGFDLGSGAFSNAYGMSSEQQKQAQAEIDGMRAKGMSDLEIVKSYMQTVGGNYGSEGFTSSVSKSPSPFQQIVGGVSSAMGAWGGMKNG